jgi:MraZ protein
MAIFLGEFEHQVDDKGRVSIPARFREQCLKETDPLLAIIGGFDPCLHIMPIHSMQEMQSLLSLERTELDEISRAFRLAYTSTGSTVTMDTQGRVPLTEKQRLYAGLDRKVMVVGNLNRIEVWDPERYARHLGKPAAEGKGMGDLASIILRRANPKTGEQ